jgi:hypothetical protein
MLNRIKKHFKKIEQSWKTKAKLSAKDRKLISEYSCAKNNLSDVDWYDSVMISLKRIFPNLVVGSSIILDDYHDWGGCRKATNEFLSQVTGQYILDDSAGSMKITKIKN